MSSPPRRRSSRLRASETPKRKNCGFAGQQLSSLTEGDETPGRATLRNARASSPVAPHTPTATSHIKPSRQEMHPSHIHHSTTKRADEGLQHGFIDLLDEKNGGALERTPSKIGAISSPSFDFRFARPQPELGPEAQRMMDELRDEALRIKVKLAAEREEEKRPSGEDGIQGRKIIKPKGKAGRYSDVHKEQFKKMDSIANHPSSFRAQSKVAAMSQTKAKTAEINRSNGASPGHLLIPRPESKVKHPEILTRIPATKSLKRSKSRAQLDDDDSNARARSGPSECHDQVQFVTPVKRARFTESQDPLAQSVKAPLPSTPTNSGTPILSRTQTMLASLTTPTRSSMAKATATKHVTNIPTSTRSPSKANVASASPSRLIKSSTMNNMNSIARSILRRPEKSVLSISKTPSRDHQKPTEPIGTPVRVVPNKANLDKELPSTPGMLQTYKGIPRHDNTPSPQKSCIPRSKSMKDVSAAAVTYPSLTASPPKQIEYPALDRQIVTSSAMAEAEDAAQVDPPTAPGIFSFRSNKTIAFDSAPRAFGASPGMSSIRAVRPSFSAGTMPGSFPVDNKENYNYLPAIPHGLTNKKHNRAVENFEELPAKAHGLSSKKRHRASSDEESEEEAGRSPKKAKSSHAVTRDAGMNVPRLQQKLFAEKAAATSKIPSPAKKKKGLSLSRLNMLARPKNRK